MFPSVQHIFRQGSSSTTLVDMLLHLTVRQCSPHSAKPGFGSPYMMIPKGTRCIFMVNAARSSVAANTVREVQVVSGRSPDTRSDASRTRRRQTRQQAAAKEPDPSSSTVTSGPGKRQGGEWVRQMLHAQDATTSRKSSSNMAASSTVQRGTGKPRRERAPPGDVSSITQRLMESAGLPPVVAAKLGAAQRKNPSIPNDPDVLQRRVLQLQQLLGREHAARAIQATPAITGRRSARHKQVL